MLFLKLLNIEIDPIQGNILESQILLSFDDLDQNPNEQKLLLNSKDEQNCWGRNTGSLAKFFMVRALRNDYKYQSRNPGVCSELRKLLFNPQQ